MLTREVVKKIHRIRIRTNRLVDAGLGGEYHSVFRGRGMEFSEVREYVPGDDVRAIDWNVTARTGVPHVKKFVEERDLTVLLVLDLSASQGFGSLYITKRDLMAELAALLAFAAVKNNDRVGALLATDRLERYIPPRKGVEHALAIARDALSFETKGRRTNLALALQSAASLLKQRSVVFVLSDFLDSGYEKPLKVLRRRHDVVCLPITDPREERLPDRGLVRLRDAETGAARVFDAADPAFRAAWGRFRKGGPFPDPIQVFRSAGIDAIPLRTDAPYEMRLVRFFKERERRKGAGR
ncbi:MAG TPA: DUF58 domain-containing protein [Thermoanaerobaculia bacterium]|nr:DUF58 domain-containing protein [Thermoanaerobaculia bacterium]